MIHSKVKSLYDDVDEIPDVLIDSNKRRKMLKDIQVDTKTLEK